MYHLRSTVLFVAMTLLLFSLEPFRREALASFGNQSLATILNEKIASEFTYDVDFDVDLFGMCSGKLLTGCAVSSEYGWRRHPIRRRSHFHTGIDLKVAEGSPIFAPSDGVVKAAGWERGYGRMVVLDHGYSWQTRYAHMSKIHVKDGDKVKKGEIIGEVGSTGVSTGPHLHFEMIFLGETVNPRRYFASLDFVRESPLTFANR